MASEMGVLPIPEKDIVTKWRLQPGRCFFMIDQPAPDEELKPMLGKSHPYKEWLERTQIMLEESACRAGQGGIKKGLCSIASRPRAIPRKTPVTDVADGQSGPRKPSAPWAMTPPI